MTRKEMVKRIRNGTAKEMLAKTVRETVEKSSRKTSKKTSRKTLQETIKKTTVKVPVREETLRAGGHEREPWGEGLQ
jgi:hypothetical protein